MTEYRRATRVASNIWIAVGWIMACAGVVMLIARVYEGPPRQAPDPLTAAVVELVVGVLLILAGVGLRHRNHVAVVMTRTLGWTMMLLSVGWLGWSLYVAYPHPIIMMSAAASGVLLFGIGWYTVRALKARASESSEVL